MICVGTVGDIHPFMLPAGLFNRWIQARCVQKLNGACSFKVMPDCNRCPLKSSKRQGTHADSHRSQQMRNLFASITLLLATVVAHGQILSHPTTVSEYTGFWRLVKVDPAYQPEPYKSKPMFQGDCQFFVHSKDGKWWHIDLKNLGGKESTESECGKQTPETLFAAPPPGGAENEVLWRPTEHPGFFVTGKANVNGLTLWKVDTTDADADTTKGIGTKIKAHDLIVQLWNPSAKAPAWVLILRPLSP